MQRSSKGIHKKDLTGQQRLQQFPQKKMTFTILHKLFYLVIIPRNIVDQKTERKNLEKNQKNCSCDSEMHSL